MMHIDRQTILCRTLSSPSPSPSLPFDCVRFLLLSPSVSLARMTTIIISTLLLLPLSPSLSLYIYNIDKLRKDNHNDRSNFVSSHFIFTSARLPPPMVHRVDSNKNSSRRRRCSGPMIIGNQALLFLYHYSSRSRPIFLTRTHPFVYDAYRDDPRKHGARREEYPLFFSALE